MNNPVTRDEIQDILNLANEEIQSLRQVGKQGDEDAERVADDYAETLDKCEQLLLSSPDLLRVAKEVVNNWDNKTLVKHVQELAALIEIIDPKD